MNRAQQLAEQQFCYPGDLFSAGRSEGEDTWMCVRTRLRWEKKLAQWLAEDIWTVRRMLTQDRVYRMKNDGGRSRMDCIR